MAQLSQPEWIYRIRFLNNNNNLRFFHKISNPLPNSRGDFVETSRKGVTILFYITLKLLPFFGVQIWHLVVDQVNNILIFEFKGHI